MKYAIVLVLTLSLFLGIVYTAGADDDFTPTFATGVYTTWDEDLEFFGTTYDFSARPTDYGWFTEVGATGTHSKLSFVCYYEKESVEDGQTVPESATLGVRFQLNSHMPFAVEEVSAKIKIGDNSEQEITFYRRDNEFIIETPASGLSASRTADTFVVGIGPFSFSHDIEGIFDVPTASNIVWCDDREE